MSYKSLESMIRSVVTEQAIEEAALGNHKGLVALAKRKTGDEKDTMMRAADMMKKGQVKDLNMFMKAMDQSTHKAIMPFVDKKHYKALHEDIEEIDEKTLTPAELKKREEIAKAIERENPDMPMPQKMAIATAQAKKVAEDKQEQVLGFIQSLSEEVELEEDSSYKTGSEKHSGGGHRAHIKNPRGGTTYLGSTTYKTAKHAKGEADAWHNAYFNTPGMRSKGNPRGAERAAHDYRKKNAQHVVEDLNEAGHDDVKSAKNQVQIAMSALEKMNGELNKLNDEDALPTWWTNKVAIAVDKLDGMADYLDTQVEEVIDEARGGADEPDRHIIMQLRKAQDVDGNHPITFRGGKTAKVQKKHIDKILKTHDHPSVKPVQKRMMRVAISKSPQHLASFADKLKEDFNVEDIDTILQETKGAPKGYHFTRSGQLKKGDAGQDGPGGAMLRSDPLDKVRKKIPPLPEETNEAVGTAAKYAGKTGFMGGKYKSHDRAMDLARDKLAKYRDKQQAKKDAAHKAQDPSMAKRGYAQNVVDREKAQRKAAEKGLGRQNISYAQGNSMRRGKLPEETDDDGREVIHTRKADFKLTKVRLPDGRMAYRKVKKEVDIEK